MLAKAIFEIAQEGMKEADRRGWTNLGCWPPIMVYAYTYGLCHGALGAAVVLVVIAGIVLLLVWLV